MSKFVFRTNRPNRTLWALLMVFALSGCATQRMYQEGVQYLDEGRYEEALQRLERAAKDDPDNYSYRTALLNARAQAVQQILHAADRNLEAGFSEQAKAGYERALKLEPENTRAKVGLTEVARRHRHDEGVKEARALFEKGDLEGVRAVVRSVLSENPKHPEARELQRQVDEKLVQDAHKPPALDESYRKPVTLQFRDANIKMVFEALSRTTGINFILDRDIKSGLKTSIFANQVPVMDTIDLIAAQNQLQTKILSENTVLIYPNTPAKIKEYQEQIVKSFYLTNVEPKKALSMLKVMLEAKVLFVDEKSNLLIMRDTPESVRMAEKLLASIDLPEPEVMMEVEVLEVKRSQLKELGVKYPNQVTLTADATTARDLKNLNSSKWKTSPVSVTFDLKKELSDANLLANPRIRARNHEKARIHIGDRVPVITNTVTPVATGAPVVTGNVTYLDVGLKLDVEPTVHLDNDVAIKVSLEVSSLVKEIETESGTLAYQIGTRNASTLLRLRDGETQILAGLISDEERKSANKVPGLGDLPIVGRLFSSHKDDNTKTEIVLSITPHLIRNLPRPDARTTEFWYGTANQKRERPLTVHSVSKIAPPVDDQKVIPKAPQPRLPGNARIPGHAAQAQVSETANDTTADMAQGKTVTNDTTKPVVLSWVGPEEVKTGEEFELQVMMESEQTIKGLTFQISYESALMEVLSVEAGELIEGVENVKLEMDQKAGRIGVSMPPVQGDGIDGRGSIVRIKFRATGAKEKSLVTMSPVAPIGSEGKAVSARPPDPYTLALNP